MLVLGYFFLSFIFPTRLQQKINKYMDHTFEKNPKVVTRRTDQMCFFF